MTCDPKWYSHKFLGPSVRYEIAVCIQTGDIVWHNGPFPCGRWAEKTIIEGWLIHLLDDDEMVETDNGYKGMPFHVRRPGNNLNHSDKVAKSMARARHEAVNRKLKTFGVLGKTFRHPLKRHKVCFKAVAVCTQASIELGEVPFRVQY